jgi:hypothetical protein
LLNLTSDQIVYNSSGDALDAQIRDALRKSAQSWIEYKNGQGTNLEDVSASSRHGSNLAYSKFILLCTLRQPAPFDEAYVRAVYEAYKMPRYSIPKPLFDIVTRSDGAEGLSYLPTYARAIGGGLGIFLLTLHASGAITLPFGFPWPGNSRDNDPSTLLNFELLRFLRSIGCQGEYEHLFDSILTDEGRKNVFRSYGTKLLLATGWKKPADVRLDDLVQLRQAAFRERFMKNPSLLPFKNFVEVFAGRFGSEVALSPLAWRTRAKESSPIEMDVDALTLTELVEMYPSDACPDRLAKMQRLPGLDLRLQDLCSEWVRLETLHLEMRKVESNKDRSRALGYLNLYLFFYLPYWLSSRPESTIAFPTIPRALIATIFVSRLIPQKFPTPMTFCEFLDHYARHRRWAVTGRYNVLKNVEGFFDYLELIGDDLPSCKGFRQPLSRHDFPVVGRPRGTAKRPVPRRLFRTYVSYVESLRAYLEVLLDKTLSGDISQHQLGAYFGNHRHSLDTFKLSRLVGFVPVVIANGRCVPLRFIPNCHDLNYYRLKDGRHLRIPRPHGLNHILVALYTGIRNNHIQWLDARTFDQLHSDTSPAFTKLWVNTDKVMNTGWSPYVDKRVIEVLRAQLQWRSLVDEPGFIELVPYMGNPKTKWPPILPLFADQLDGNPHPDSRYEYAWDEVLLGVQWMLSDFGLADVGPLCELLPNAVPFNAHDKRAALAKYADSRERVIELRIKSDITPHSARVGVVSRLIQVLPADMIGEYVTGQRPGSVYHYVHIDPNDLRAIAAVQALATTGSDALDCGVGGRHYLKADEVNSNLRRAMSADMESTIARYGCISLTLVEGRKTGIDVLRETRGSSASYSKTEICPYGHQCPPEVIKDLRGFGRCAMCRYAVRSIDHLPAVAAKTRQAVELLEAIEKKLDGGEIEKYTDAELDQLEGERQRLADDATAWHLIGEVLEHQRALVASGTDARTWVIPEPEILEQSLRRVTYPSNETAYLLARLPESVAYPTFDSPEIVARFDLLRRQLLANLGDVRQALVAASTNDVSKECIGLLKAVTQANSMTPAQVVNALTSHGSLPAISATRQPILLLTPQ